MKYSKSLLFNVKLQITLLLLIFSAHSVADLGGGSSTPPKELPDNIVALVDAENYDQAINELDAFISDESDNADAWNYLGYSQRNIGLLDDSLVSYKKALKLDRKHLGAHEYIGELYLTMNDAKAAKKHLKKLRRYCGDCEQYQDLAEAIEKFEADS